MLICPSRCWQTALCLTGSETDKPFHACCRRSSDKGAVRRVTQPLLRHDVCLAFRSCSSYQRLGFFSSSHSPYGAETRTASSNAVASSSPALQILQQLCVLPEAEGICVNMVCCVSSYDRPRVQIPSPMMGPMVGPIYRNHHMYGHNAMRLWQLQNVTDPVQK